VAGFLVWQGLLCPPLVVQYSHPHIISSCSYLGEVAGFLAGSVVSTTGGTVFSSSNLLLLFLPWGGGWGSGWLPGRVCCVHHWRYSILILILSLVVPTLGKWLASWQGLLCPPLAAQYSYPHIYSYCSYLGVVAGFLAGSVVSTTGGTVFSSSYLLLLFLPWGSGWLPGRVCCVHHWCYSILILIFTLIVATLGKWLASWQGLWCPPLAVQYSHPHLPPPAPPSGSRRQPALRGQMAVKVQFVTKFSRFIK
jgi:hypothetical protein